MSELAGQSGQALPLFPLPDCATFRLRRKCQSLEMRLYLSSFDLGDRPEELVALTTPASRVAIIVNALDNQMDVQARFLKEQTAKLIGLGFSVLELDLRSYFGWQDKLEVLLRDTDLVWADGGNAFILRRAMKPPVRPGSRLGDSALGCAAVLSRELKQG